MIPFKISDIEKNFIELTEAMVRISTHSRNPNVATIGNLAIRVRINKQGKFEYMAEVVRGFSNEEGSFGITLLTSSYPNYGIGIYYQKGEFGDIFICGDSEYSKRIKASTLHEFIQISRDNHKLNLIGATW
ncbi:MAG: hypothetical protein ACYCQI_15395 [Gammaproteobacteria bacterium]